MSKQFNATEVEMYKIGTRLRGLHSEVQRVLLTNRNAAGYLHSSGSSKIVLSDMSSVEGVDISNGSAKLSGRGHRLLDLSKIKGVRVDPYTTTNVDIVPGSSSDSSIMFDDIEDDYYMTTFTIDGYTERAGIRIMIPLGREVPVDRVIVDTIPGTETEVSLKYLNGNITADFASVKPILVGGTYSSTADFLIPSASPLGNSYTVSTLLLTMSKLPDTTAANGSVTTSTYRFLIRKISVESYISDSIGNFITNPIELASSAADFSANQVSLSTNDIVPEGCGIDYYIAVDPWVAGYLTKSAARVPWVSTLTTSDVDSFSTDTNYSGTEGVRASELNRLGVVPWSPYWVPIAPIERPNTTISASGDAHGTVINLGAYTMQEDAADFISDTTPSGVNGIYFYDIYRFDRKPVGVTLRQGRHCWVQRMSGMTRYRTVEVSATFRSVSTAGFGTDYYIDIGPTYNDAEGYVRSHGYVVDGSVTNIMWTGGNPDDPSQALLTYENIDSNMLSDIHISYSNGVASLTKNPATVWSFPNYSVKFKYTYIDESDRDNVVESSIYVPPTASPYIVINEADGVNKVLVDVPDNDYIKTGEYLQMRDGVRLPLSEGWNTVKVYLASSTAWNPTTNISMPAGLDWYSYYAPLELVGAGTLYYNTHRDDHTKCSLRHDNEIDKYYLIVNDPVTPSGTITNDTFSNDGMVYWKEDGGIIDSRDDIFYTAYDVDNFYDLDYKEIGDYYTHVMLKGVLTGTGNSTPVIYSYEVRGGDSLDITVEV
jgi:hypothetical protein